MTLLPMENKESILYALKCIEKEKSTVTPPILDEYVKQIAMNGQTMLPWVFVKPLLLRKFSDVLEDFMNIDSADFLPLHDITELKSRVYECLNYFDGIPFTIQRICELFDSPRKHYNRVDKFLRGLEKVCMVVTTVDPQGNKIHREDPRFPSQAGLEDCGLIGSDGLLSPPSSPSVESFHTQRNSKSSDEDVSEEDENYDESESTSTGNLSSPRNSLCSPHVTRVSTPETWPFGSGVTDTSEQLRDQCVEGHSDGAPGSQTSPSSLCSSTSSTDHVMADEEVESDGNVMHSSDEELSDACMTDAAVATPSDDEPSVTTLTTTISDEPACRAESVPPIVQILRPIGQLEAFVQNMGVDVPCPTSLPALLSSPTMIPESAMRETGIKSPCDSLERSLPVLEVEELSQISDVKPPVSPQSVPGGKRRADGPIDGTGTAPLKLILSSSEHQSPAKRRRLSGSDSSTDAAAISPTYAQSLIDSSLNDSPPVIVSSSPPCQSLHTEKTITVETLKPSECQPSVSTETAEPEFELSSTTTTNDDDLTANY